MTKIQLYPQYEEAFFVERDNRFVMTLRKGDRQEIKAYIANPGRMEEFLVPGHRFFITPGNQGKYFYRIVSTFYEDSFILTDTIKINFLVQQLLEKKLIPEFENYTNLKREVTVDRSKFDFQLEGISDKPTLLEVKSCSLCHKGLCMFPDAPTTRGKRHLEDLDKLANNGYDTYTLYLTTHKTARQFTPNGHTDPDYCATFHASKNIEFLAYSLEMADPVSVFMDKNHLKRIPLDLEKAGEICKDRGSYLLILHNEKTFSETIGALGEREFPAGYYVYVGSAMQGLEKRINRHKRKTKKTHWHLDYISPTHMKIIKAYRIRRQDRLEERLAKELSKISKHSIPGFGASDTKENSHLFYFSNRPNRRRDFIDLLLDAQMFGI